jgi:hypothetical protein
VKQSNGIDTRDTGLIAPRNTGDGAIYESAADVIKKQIEEENPLPNAKNDVVRLFAENVPPEKIVSIILIRNKGLKQIDAVSLVNEITQAGIDSSKFKFSIQAADMVMGDAPETKKVDPRLTRILEAQKDVERCLRETDMAHDLIARTVSLRNNVSVADVTQIIESVMRES